MSIPQWGLHCSEQLNGLQPCPGNYQICGHGGKTPRATVELNRIPELFLRIGLYSNKDLLPRQSVELTLFVFIRFGELYFARWVEVDFETAMWTTHKQRKPLKGVRHSERILNVFPTELISFQLEFFCFFRILGYDLHR